VHHVVAPVIKPGACTGDTGLSMSAISAKQWRDSRTTWSNSQKQLRLTGYRLTDERTRTKHGQFWVEENLQDLQAENFFNEFREFLVEPKGIEPSTS
jgi:hypothetical protein